MNEKSTHLRVLVYRGRRSVEVRLQGDSESRLYRKSILVESEKVRIEVGG